MRWFQRFGWLGECCRFGAFDMSYASARSSGSGGFCGCEVTGLAG